MDNMDNYSGDDLLTVFSILNIDMRSLNSNVVKAWFDTDCKNTKHLLNWMCFSLSSLNYLSSLEKAEYDSLETHLDTKTCIEELGKIDSDLSIFDLDENIQDINYMLDEIELLEEENKTLDQFIDSYNKLENNMSLDLTQQTQKDIKVNVECKKAHEDCINLCECLSKINTSFHQRLSHYEPDAYFVNYVDCKEYLDIIDYLNSFLIPFMDIDNTMENSEDAFVEGLETCRKRILHSHQIYLVNKVELEKLKEILEFLNKLNISEGISSLNVSTFMNIEAKEMYKKRLCEVLDSKASKYAEHHLKLMSLHYVQKELEYYQQKSQNIFKIQDLIITFLSYCTLTNCILLEEKKDVECINSFYQKMVKYVNDDLYKCRQRTEQMTEIIEEYKKHINGPDNEKMKFITSIAKVLSCGDYSLKAVFNAVQKLKSELSYLESQIFCVDFPNEKKKSQKISENIKILKNFLISGPTARVVLVPTELQNVWRDIEDHLKKESISISEAVQAPQLARRAITKEQNYTKLLWTHFLTNSSKVKSILEQAEADFLRRTAEHH